MVALALFMLLSAWPNSAKAALEQWIAPKNLNPVTQAADQPAKQQNFSIYTRAFQRKCGSSTISCFLTEADLDAQGRADHVLIFRGENAINSMPATAGFFRWAVVARQLCHGKCTPADITKAMYNHLNPSTEINDDYYAPTDSWVSYGGAGLNDGRYTPVAVHQTGLTKTQILVGGHYFGYGLKIFTDLSGNSKGAYDPFVSFSSDPNQVIRFTTLSGAAVGRIFIASIPLSKMIKLQPDNCKTDFMFSVDSIYDASACGVGDGGAVPEEREIDAFLYLPETYLYSTADAQN